MCMALLAAGRNVMRGAILGLMATFAGILLFSAPEYIKQIFKIQLPIADHVMVSKLVSLPVYDLARIVWKSCSLFACLYRCPSRWLGQASSTGS